MTFSQTLNNIFFMGKYLRLYQITREQSLNATSMTYQTRSKNVDTSKLNYHLQTENISQPMYQQTTVMG